MKEGREAKEEMRRNERTKEETRRQGERRRKRGEGMNEGRDTKAVRKGGRKEGRKEGLNDRKMEGREGKKRHLATHAFHRAWHLCYFSTTPHPVSGPIKKREQEGKEGCTMCKHV